MVVAGSAPYAIGLYPEHVFQANALRREVPDDPDDPAQRIAIRSQSRVRPIAFDLAVAEKIRHEFADRRLPLWIGKPRIAGRCMLFVALNRPRMRHAERIEL